MAASALLKTGSRAEAAEFRPRRAVSPFSVARLRLTTQPARRGAEFDTLASAPFLG
ncbi:MAG TPA: hypothetical protein VJJ47_03335 [Candidatus Paceibacterota bacterium]